MERFLARRFPRLLRRAVQEGLQDVAADAQREVRTSMPEAFEPRRGFLQRSVEVRGAALLEQTVSIGSAQPYLMLQATGGEPKTSKDVGLRVVDGRRAFMLEGRGERLLVRRESARRYPIEKLYPFLRERWPFEDTIRRVVERRGPKRLAKALKLRLRRGRR